MENKDDTEQLQAIYNGILDIPTISNNILKKIIKRICRLCCYGMNLYLKII